MLPKRSSNVPHDCVAEAAYFLWLGDGMSHGRDLAHWLQAERDHAAAAPAPPVRKRSLKPRDATAPSGRVYRLKFLAQDGTVKFVLAMPAANNGEALAEAEHFRDDRRLEVWLGDTRIGAFAAASTEGGTYAASSAAVSSSSPRTVAR